MILALSLFAAFAAVAAWVKAYQVEQKQIVDRAEADRRTAALVVWSREVCDRIEADEAQARAAESRLEQYADRLAEGLKELAFLSADFTRELRERLFGPQLPRPVPPPPRKVKPFDLLRGGKDEPSKAP